MIKSIVFFTVGLLVCKQAICNIQQLKEINLGFSGENPQQFSIKSHNKTVVCALNPWSFWRTENVSKFNLANIQPELCSHILYNGPTIDNKTFGIISSDFYLESQAGGHQWFTKVPELKKSHPHLKIILSVGKWDSGVKTFQDIASDSNKRKSFIDSAVGFMKKYDFDGLNIAWMWPAVPYRGGVQKDKTDLTVLLYNIKEAFAVSKLSLGLLLNGDVSIVKGGYDLQQISNIVDDIYILAIDYTGNWHEKTGHHSQLQNPSDKAAGQSQSISKIVDFLIEQKVPSNKLILGIGFIGRTFKLVNEDEDGHGFASPATKGTSFPATFYSSAHELPYNEICYEWKINGENWTFYRDSNAKAPFMKNGQKWISFDDPQSIREKVEFGISRKLQGFMAWTIDTDDFTGVYCDANKVTYPLLRTINQVLTEAVVQVKTINGTKGRSELDISLEKKEKEKVEKSSSSGNTHTAYVHTIALVVAFKYFSFDY